MLSLFISDFVTDGLCVESKAALLRSSKVTFLTLLVFDLMNGLDVS
jgi:hypothetical protein